MTKWTPDIRRKPGPRYLAIANAIAEAVSSGELKPGTRLPTHRELAGRLKVSVHTVSAAYAAAERHGDVIGEVGRGTFVQARSRDGGVNYILDRRPQGLVDLSIATPASSQVHARAIREAMRELARGSAVEAMTAFRPINGAARHREAAARWLEPTGLDPDPERILISNGAAHGLQLALATLTNPGDLVLTSSLVDHGIISLASVLHFRLAGLPIDEHGILPEAFDEACRGGEVKVLCCTPTLNNPTSSLMPLERRRALADIAVRHHVAIVEDDVYGPLLADAPPALSSLVPEISIYVTSFTKSVVAGLRTGYVVAPDSMIQRLATRLRATSWMGTPLLAEIAAQWIGDGTAAALVSWQREELTARQLMVREVLGDYDVAAHPQGLNAWLTLPSHWRARSFVSQAALKYVAVTPAEPFVVGRLPEPHAVRISLGVPAGREELRRGLEVLAEILQRAPEPAPLAL